MSDQTQDDNHEMDDALDRNSAFAFAPVYGSMMVCISETEYDDLTQRLAAVVAERDQLRQELAAIKDNGYIPSRDSIGGVLITREWDTPEEDAAWAHLGNEGEADHE